MESVNLSTGNTIDLVVLPASSLTAEKPAGTAGDGDKAEAAKLAELAESETKSGQCMPSRRENLEGLVEPVRKWMFDNVAERSKTDVLHLDHHQFAVATPAGTTVDLGVNGTGAIHVFAVGYGPVSLETKEKATKSPWEVVFKQHNANHTDSAQFAKTGKDKTSATIKGSGCVLLLTFRLLEGKR